MRILLAGLSGLIIWMAGCDRKTTAPLETTTSEGQASQAPAGTAAARKDHALVRFVNADPGSEAQELWTSDMRLFAGIGYKTVTPYIEIPSQATQFRLREGAGQKDLADVHDELFAGRSYTYVAMRGKDGRSSLAEVSDDLTPPKAGKAKVRVINATQGVDNLYLYMEGVTNKIGQRVRTGAVTEFKDVDPGTFEIHPATRPAVPRLSKLIVERDHFYTFVVLGQSDDLDVVRVEEHMEIPHAD